MTKTRDSWAIRSGLSVLIVCEESELVPVRERKTQQSSRPAAAKSVPRVAAVVCLLCAFCGADAKDRDAKDRS